MSSHCDLPRLLPRAALALACSLAAVPLFAQGARESLEGYAEFRHGDQLVVDGQRVTADRATRFSQGVRGLGTIPLGYEVKLKGVRQADGSVLAEEVETKPNRLDSLDRRVRAATNQAESAYRRSGRFSVGSGRQAKSVGRLYDRGSDVARARRVVSRLVPPYVDADDVRVYVVDNKEWNAAAMGNFSVYVFRGLMRDMDDDELAIVLGHELAHATHEHTRRQFRKAMWVQLAALGLMVAAEKKIDDRKSRALAQLVTVFLANTYRNGYGRELEDQADRVGLRYAYEAGYDVSRGPGLWRRFGRRYGERSRTANFFFGDHSLATDRARNLERELALNYEPRRSMGSRERSR